MKSMKRKISIILIAIVVLVCLASCANNPQGNVYYCTTDSNEYIEITSVESETKAIVSVTNLTLPNYSISDYTASDIVVNIYMTDANNENLQYFKSTINGKTVQGTINFDAGEIVINEKIYRE